MPAYRCTRITVQSTSPQLLSDGELSTATSTHAIQPTATSTHAIQPTATMWVVLRRIPNAVNSALRCTTLHYAAKCQKGRRHIRSTDVMNVPAGDGRAPS